MAKFEILPNRSGQYYWHLKADNGEIVAVSESFTSKYGATRSAETVKALAGRSLIVDMTTQNNRWF